MHQGDSFLQNRLTDVSKKLRELVLSLVRVMGLMKFQLNFLTALQEAKREVQEEEALLKQGRVGNKLQRQASSSQVTKQEVVEEKYFQQIDKLL